MDQLRSTAPYGRNWKLMKRRMGHHKKANLTSLNHLVPLIIGFFFLLPSFLPSFFFLFLYVLFSLSLSLSFFVLCYWKECLPLFGWSKQFNFPHDFFIRVANPVKRRCHIGFQSLLPLVQCTVSYLKTHNVVNFTNYCTPDYVSTF